VSQKLGAKISFLRGLLRSMAKVPYFDAKSLENLLS
jgi:hypothetical protein